MRGNSNRQMSQKMGGHVALFVKAGLIGAFGGPAVGLAIFLVVQSMFRHESGPRLISSGAS